MPLIESEGSPFWADVESEGARIVDLVKEPGKQYISPFPSELKYITREAGARMKPKHVGLGRSPNGGDPGRLQGQVYVISIQNRMQNTIDGRKPNPTGRRESVGAPSPNAWRVWLTNLYDAARGIVEQKVRLAEPDEIEHMHADAEREKIRIAKNQIRLDAMNGKAVIPASMITDKNPTGDKLEIENLRLQLQIEQMKNQQQQPGKENANQ